MIRSRSMQQAVLAMLVAFATLGVATTAVDASTDLPPATANLQSIPTGSLVIPMDSAKQNLDGTPFNLKAYGLVTQLLWAEIPVRWSIKAGKTKDQADFTATAVRLYPTPGSPATLSFSGGPFIILARDVQVATPIINSFGGNVAVYQLTAAATIDIRYTLLHKPKVAVLNDGGNEQIHRAILDAAGFIPTTQYATISATTLTTINANSCYTIGTEPHFDVTNPGDSDAQAQAIRTFANSGGNFLAQCVATLTYENNPTYGKYQTTRGIIVNNSGNTIYDYPNPDFSFSQYDGQLKSVGGSVNDFQLDAGSAFRNGGHVHVENTPLPGLYVATAAKLTAGTGSMVFYLGGHKYDTTSLEGINGMRMYLNAVLTPAARPAPCLLNFTDTPTEIHGKIYEDVDGDGSLTDGVVRSGVTVRAYKDGGDGLPTGADDTLAGTTTTAADGTYGFTGLVAGANYWVAVDSKTVTPSTALTSSGNATDVWAEQTYGTYGARCDDGNGGTMALTAPGTCFGGKSRLLSDVATSLASSEHVALTTPGTAGRNVDFGFSFVTIASTRDGDDDGSSTRTVQGSFRQFIQNSNDISGVQRSMFRLKSAASPSGPWTITPTAALPIVTDPVTIDGSTQTGFAGAPLVELDGSAGRLGLIVNAGNSTVRSLAINRFIQAGVTFDVNNGNHLEGCYLGTNPAGTAGEGNGDVGVLVSSNNNTIGGTTAATRNVISANAHPGVKIDNGTTGNVVSGNYIGTNAAGTAALGNNDVGIDVRGPGNTIGGIVAGAGNVISANAHAGIRINPGATTGNTVQGNLIGTNAAGTAALGNTGPGIDIRSATNTIGGTAALARNVISGNASGIDISQNGGTGNVIQGNFIGTDIAGTAALGNTQEGVSIDTGGNNTVGGTAAGAGNVIAWNGGTGVSIMRQPVGNAIRGNAIHDNGALGIDLQADGVTPNDPGDTDIGPNDLQNFPVLTSVAVLGGNTTIGGTLASTPSSTFALDFFASNAQDPSGYGEGGRYLGSGTATTDGSGNASFSTVLAATSVTSGEVVTATATASDASTSEFSRAFTFVSVSGKVVEDVDGNGDLADAVGRPSVSVRLYQDGGDGLPTGTDDVLIKSTVTDASGAYVFNSVISGTYWVVVDSKTVTPSAALNAGAAAGDLWAEQSFGANGALCDNGSGGVNTLAAPGPCYGGRRSAVSDNAAVLATSEHVAKVSVVATALTGIDFGFAFTPVVNTREGDDDLTANRTIQGSLRQFVQNGNGISGNATSVFRIPHSDLGYNGTGNGEYTIKLLAALPDVTDPLVIDGSTQTGWNGPPIIELTGNAAGNSSDGLRVTGGQSTIRKLVINRFKLHGIELTGATGDHVEGCYIGTGVTGLVNLGNSGHGIEVSSGGHVIGGAAPGAGNIISSNSLDGVHISGTLATGNSVLGNLIGPDASGATALKNNAYGIEIAAGASGNRIGSTASGGRNVVSGNNLDGIHVTGANTSGNIVEGNYIGTTSAGSAALQNNSDGISMDLGASGNTIGGTPPGSGNVISGNHAAGVFVTGSGTSGNVIQGNTIGLNAAGTAAVGNNNQGILITLSASTNTVGGTTAGAGNVVSGNNGNGVEVSGNPPPSSIIVQGNRIGTNAAGTAAIGNVKIGVDMEGGTGHQVGGTSSGAGNVISGNGDTGVAIAGASSGVVVQGNFVGTNAAAASMGNAKIGVDVEGGTGHQVGGTIPGAANVIAWNVRQGVVVNGNASACAIRQNSIHDNSMLGIDLKANGVTANDLNDIDTGPNDVQNYPVLSAATSGGGTTVVTGVLNSTPSASFVLEFFASPTGDPLGYGEGQTYLGTTTVTTDATGNASFTATLPMGTPNGYVVTATATNSGNKTSEFSATRVVSSLIDLSMAKSVNNPTPTVGTNVVFTLTLNNATGSANATGVVVKDILPAGYTYISDDSATTGTTYASATGLWTVGNVAAGSSIVLKITARVNPTGPYLNAAEVSAAAQGDIDSTPGDGTGDDYATATTTPVTPIDLSLAKTVDNPTPVVGTNVVFKIALSNAAGLANATGIQVKDLLPAGYVYVSDDAASTGTTYAPATGLWSVSSLASGATVILKITARVNATGSWTNVAEVMAAGQPDVDSTPGDGTGDDYATVSTSPGVPLIDLSLAKTVDNATPNVGANVVFKLDLSNQAGFSNATGVQVKDLLPAGYTFVSDDAASTGTTYAPATGIWNVGNVAAGSTITLKITAHVNGTGPFLNAAEVVAAVEPDTDSTPNDGTGDDYATASTAPVPQIDLSLTKTANPATPAIGGTVVFSITVTNVAGLSNATGVVVKDLLPAGFTYLSDDAGTTGTTYAPASGQWIVGNVAAGSSVALKITARVNVTGPYLNVAEVTAATQNDVDSTPGDGTGDDYASVNAAPVPPIDLSLAKTVDNATPNVGSNVVFTVVLSNATGMSTATGVQVKDLLPAGYTYVGDDAVSSGTTYASATGLWTVGNVAAGSSVTLKITARVNGSGPRTNTAEVVAAAEPDVDSTPGDGTGDDFASVSTAPVPRIDLSLTKSANPTTPAIGGTVVFTVIVTNAIGMSDATGVVVKDLLPSGFTYLSDDAGTTGTTYAPATGLWTAGNVAAGVSVPLKISARVNVTGSYVNVAEVTAAGETDVDSTPGDGTGDDYATASATPAPPIDLSLAKFVNNPTPVVGTNVVFRVDLSNAAGMSNATGIQVKDLLPAGYTYVSDDSATTGTTYASATGIWSVGSLAAGTTVSLKITARVNAAGSWTNAAEVVAAGEPDLDSTPGDGTGDDYATASTTPVPVIDLSLTKTVNAPSPSVGGTVVFTVTVTDAAGLSNATGVIVRDLLPAGYAYVSDDSATTGTTYAPTSGNWTVGAVAAGSSVTLKITARVNPSGSYLNAAEVTAAGESDVDSTPGDGTGDDYATASTTPVPPIDLSLTKIANDPTPSVGGVDVFKIDLNNAAGMSNATGIQVRDLLPAGYTYVSDNAASTGTTYAPATGIWTVASLAAGTSVTLNITVRVNAHGRRTNVAEVVAANETDADSVPGDGTGDDYATASTAPVPAIDLSLAKSVTPTTPAVGGTAVFSVVVTNAAGLSDATGVVVKDLLPAGYTLVSDDAATTGTTYAPATGLWTVGNVPSGSSVTLKITTHVNASGPYVNTAEVTAAGEADVDSTPGDGTGDDYAQVSTTPSAAIDLSLTKTVNVTSPNIGTNVVFTVTVTNAAGLSDATGVAVTDLLPAGFQYVSDDSATTGTTYASATGVWTVGNVAAGASKALKITAKVRPSGPYLNVAEVTAAGQTDVDSQPGDGTGDDYASVQVTPAAPIDLSLVKTVDNAAPPVGSSVVFTLTVMNAAGGGNATGVAVTDLLPAGYRFVSDDAATTGTTYVPANGVWTVGNVAAGASVTLKIRATVLPVGPWPNSAEVTAADQPDVDSTPGDGTGDDHAFVDVAPTPQIDLSLTKTVDVPNPMVGTAVVFTITVNNATGLSTATGVAVKDTLPVGYAYVSDDASTTGTTYAPATGMWTIGTVAAGASISLHLRVTVLHGGPYVNAAEVVAAGEPDVDSVPNDGAGAGEDDGALRGTTPLGTDGTVTVTPTIYPGDALTVTVTDADANGNPAVAETVLVVVVDQATGETEHLTLTETGPDTGVFRAALATVFGTAAGNPDDGTISVQASDAIQATYQDTVTAAGGSATRVATGHVIGGVSGTLTLTPRSLPGETLTATVTDADLNVNPAVPDTVQVTIVDDLTDETEIITLTETGPSTGIFVGTLPTSSAALSAASGDGILNTRIGDTLTGTYDDARTASGASAAVTATSLVAGEVIRITKTAGKDQATVGTVVPYAIRATATVSVSGATISDLIPAGFKLVEGSARLSRAGADGHIGTPDDVTTVLGATGVRPVTFGPFDLAAGESVDVTYALRVGAGAGLGPHANTATPMQGTLTAGGTATATVTIVADPVFDQSTIIGKVFEDKNRNDWQDEGEEGVAHAMVVLDDGTYVVTDEVGRFHFPATNPGHRMVKLNVSTLPPGTEVVGDDSRVLWITPGVPVRVDFGVVLPAAAPVTIGAPPQTGVHASGVLEPTAVEVRGSLTDVTVLVNDTLVPLSTSEVKLQVKPLDEIIQLIGNALPHPVTFSMKAEANESVAHWSLAISDLNEEPVKVIEGDGPVPESILWDATTTAGGLVQSGQIYEYQLSLRYADGNTSQSAKRIFGVNRETVVSLELTGDAFATGKAELTPAARKTLDRAAQILTDYPREKVMIEGHTDSVGSAESNLELSKKRAEAARDYLVHERGVASDRLTLQWYGETRPKASNDIPEGRAVNRRVEIKGQVQRVESADLNAHIRAEPFVYINKERVSVPDSGRFSATVPGDKLSSNLEIEIANGQGRTVWQKVALPILRLTTPDGAALTADGVPPPAGTSVARVQGVTQSGNSLTVDGKPVSVGADGTFELELPIASGKSTYPVIVRNSAGVSLGSNLVLSLSDKDAAGHPVLVSQGIPNLSLDLPPDGAKLPGKTLVIQGHTDPGNKLTVNGHSIPVERDGTIHGAIDLPVGRSHVVAEVTDAHGGTGRIERDFEVPKNQLFLLALADGQYGKLSGKGQIEAAGKDHEDGYYAEGRVAYYLKGVIAGKYLITSAFDSDRQTNGTVFADLNGTDSSRLLTNLDPDRYYPVYGDDSTLVYDVESQGKFYLAVDSDTMSAVVGNYPLAFKDTELSAYQRTLYGARYAYRSLAHTKYGDPDTSVIVFGAQVRQAHVRDELRATGGSLYYLSHQALVEGSEQVTLVVRDKNTRLLKSQESQRQNVDYTIKYPEGRITFLRPIASVAQSASITDPQILNGDPVYIQVDYEAAVQGFEKTAAGARARQQIGDHVAVGATYVKDELQGGKYELGGFDTEVKLGKSTRVVAEYATSTGADSLAYVSEDGGISYATVATTGTEQGSAFKIAADVDAGEWFHKPDRYHVRAYYKELEPGFFSNGNFQEQGTTKEGVNGDFVLTDRDTLRFHYDQEERTGTSAALAGVTHDSDTGGVAWEHRQAKWGTTVELFKSVLRDAQGLSLGDSGLAAVRGWMHFTEKFSGRLDLQKSVSGPANDQATTDLQYQVLPSLALEGKGTVGSRGHSGEAGAVYTNGGTNIYLTERTAEDQTGNRTATVLGARSPIGAASHVYTEYQWEDTDSGKNAISLVGVQKQWDLGPGFKLVLSGENAHVKSTATQNGTNVPERNRSALATSVSYELVDVWSVISRNEIRFDEGAVPAPQTAGRRRQYLTFNQFSYKLSRDLSLVGKLSISNTENTTTGLTEAKYDERSIGFAYRPAASDRFNALGRYTHLRDLRPVTPGAPNPTDRTMDVFSVETIFRITPRVEWAAKLAARAQQEFVTAVGPVDSDTLLTIQRFNVNFWRQFDLGVEYRILRERQTDDQRQGWLSEFMWQPIKRFRVGLGYNFTNFSDNEFSANDYSQSGWFVRVQGRY